MSWCHLIDFVKIVWISSCYKLLHFCVACVNYKKTQKRRNSFLWFILGHRKFQSSDWLMVVTDYCILFFVVFLRNSIRSSESLDGETRKRKDYWPVCLGLTNYSDYETLCVSVRGHKWMDPTSSNDNIIIRLDLIKFLKTTTASCTRVPIENFTICVLFHTCFLLFLHISSPDCFSDCCP